jgi:hypothetical protein
LYLSVTGNFAITLFLSLVGVASIATSSCSRRRFAAIPLLFAVQQAAEGAAWLTMAEPRTSLLHASAAILHVLALNLSLGIALVVWPTWLPLSLSLVEPRPLRRWALGLLSRFGTLVSGCAAVLLLRWRPGACIVGGGLTYDSLPGQNLADQLICLLAFVIATIVPFFVSTARSMSTMGITLVASLIVTAGVQPSLRTSVWCLFAVVLSLLILSAEWRERQALTPTEGCRADRGTKWIATDN